MKTKYLTILLIVLLTVAALASVRSGTTYKMQSDVIDSGGKKSSGTTRINRVGSSGQLTPIGKNSGSSYIDHAGYVYQTNSRPNTPESLSQYKDGGVIVIPWPAGWTNTTTEVLKADISDPDPGDILVLEVEVQLSGEAFTDLPSFESGSIDYSGTTINASVSATDMEHAKSYIWQARVKDLENYYSDWVTLNGDPDYRVDLVPPGIPLYLLAFASPESSPSYVYLTWTATTDPVSGLAGYNVYRSVNSPGSNYSEYYSLLSETSTQDAGVSVGTDYYYVVAAEDQAGNVGTYSNQGSAPHIYLTREADVDAPVVGGYTGQPTDSVPGSTITFSIYYTNNGFAIASSVEVVDKVPPYTEFDLDSATGEAISDIKYSDDNGATFTYTPSGTYVDGNVTHVKWLCLDISSSTEAKKVEYGVVIR